MPPTAPDLQRRAASRFVVGFDGTAMSPELGELIDAGVSGIILFRRNIVDPWQVAELIADVRRRAARPFIVAADQEGGPVQRLRAPFLELPAAAVFGTIDDPSLTAAAAKAMGRELGALGFDLCWAPVVDVNTNPANPVIGVRSFGATPEVVSRHAKAWIPAMQGAGVAACAKHFPGHGDTNLDSHFDLPSVDQDKKRIESVELPPFRAAIAARVATVMTAHVVFRALDPGVPATLSKKTLEGLLRKRMRFGGLIVSDDMEMKAIADHHGVAEASVETLRAGSDVVLVCKTRERVLESIEAVRRALESKSLRIAPAAEKRLAGHLRRWSDVAPPAVPRAKKIVGSDAHRRLAERIAKRAAKAGVSWTPPAGAVATSPVSTT